MQQGWAKVTRKLDMMNTRQYLDMRYEAYKNDGIDISTLTSNDRNYDLTLAGYYPIYRLAKRADR